MSEENHEIMPEEDIDMDTIGEMFPDETGQAGTRPKKNTKKNMASETGVKAKTQVPHNTDLIMDIPVEVQVVLGSTTMPVANLMNLGRGAVVTLDKQIGDPVDIVVNGRIIARGEVIVMEDDSSRFGVSLTEVIGK